MLENLPASKGARIRGQFFTAEQVVAHLDPDSINFGVFRGSRSRSHLPGRWVLANIRSVRVVSLV